MTDYKELSDEELLLAYATANVETAGYVPGVDPETAEAHMRAADDEGVRRWGREGLERLSVWAMGVHASAEDFVAAARDEAGLLLGIARGTAVPRWMGVTPRGAEDPAATKTLRGPTKVTLLVEAVLHEDFDGTRRISETGDKAGFLGSLDLLLTDPAGVEDMGEAEAEVTSITVVRVEEV